LDEEERLCSLIADAISPRLVPNVEMVTVDNLHEHRQTDRQCLENSLFAASKQRRMGTLFNPKAG
jgi:hypothetical protein